MISLTTFSSFLFYFLVLPLLLQFVEEFAPFSVNHQYVVEAFGTVDVVVRRTSATSSQQQPLVLDNNNNDDIQQMRKISMVLAASTSSTPPTTVNGEAEHDDDDKKPSTSIPLDQIRLSVSEKARTVTEISTSGTMCTVSAHDGIQGAPFGSFVDYVLDESGNPIFLMNDMSMHTINIQKAQDADNNGGAALVTLFTQLASKSKSSGNTKNSNLQDVSRCSLTGTLSKMDANDPEMDAIRMRYSLTHAYADQVMDSPKFAFYRLQPTAIYFVGGFGVLAKWIDPIEYATAAPDILARDAADMVIKINRQHADDMILTAQHLLKVDTAIEKIRLTNVDRLGMDIRVTSQMGTRRNKLQTDEFRIGFRIPVISVEDAKSEILKVFQEAWEIGNGYSYGDDDDSSGEQLGSDVPIIKIAADSLE